MRVIAFHVIITAYGFWLPNDLRGSWSDWVRAWELAKLGPATKVSTHRSLARKTHDVKEPLAAKRALARGRWKRFCLTADDVRRSIRYVQDNPIKEGLRRQTWSFVTPYEA